MGLFIWAILAGVNWWLGCNCLRFTIQDKIIFLETLVIMFIQVNFMEIMFLLLILVNYLSIIANGLRLFSIRLLILRKDSLLFFFVWISCSFGVTDLISLFRKKSIEELKLLGVCIRLLYFLTVCMGLLEISWGHSNLFGEKALIKYF